MLEPAVQTGMPIDVTEAVRLCWKRKGDSFRVDVDLIGFWATNRAHTCINGRHCHQIATDILANQLRRSWYDRVDFWEDPEPLLKKSKSR